MCALLIADAKGQGVTAPTDAELAAITERGRLLAEYDQAAWHASDAVQTANPKTVEGQHYIAKKENGKWRVVFGAVNADKSRFVIGYEAEQQAKPKEFLVKRDEPARVDGGFYLFAARALELALADFGPAARPYNAAVLPAGGDARYLVSAEGTKILAKRQMHKSVIESRPPKGKKVEAGFHTHVLSDVPEDTDVLHVLQQDPPVPEFVSTAHFLYEILANGTIQVKKERRK